jgi:hypothetical protein
LHGRLCLAGKSWRADCLVAPAEASEDDIKADKITKSQILLQVRRAGESPKKGGMDAKLAAMMDRRRAASEVDYEWDGEGNSVASPSDVSHIPDIGLKGGKLLGNTLQKAFAYQAKSPEPERTPNPKRSPAARGVLSPRQGADEGGTSQAAAASRTSPAREDDPSSEERRVAEDQQQRYTQAYLQQPEAASALASSSSDEEEELPGAPAGAGGAGGRAAKALDEEEEEDVDWKEAIDLLRARDRERMVRGKEKQEEEQEEEM